MSETQRVSPQNRASPLLGLRALDNLDDHLPQPEEGLAHRRPRLPGLADPPQRKARPLERRVGPLQVRR